MSPYDSAYFCRLFTSVEDNTKLISLKLHVAQIQCDSKLSSLFSWPINGNANNSLELFCRFIFFVGFFLSHDQTIQEQSWISTGLCTLAVTIFPGVLSCFQNENMTTTSLSNFMPLLQVRTWKCHATNRHYVVRFADSAIRIRASFPTIQSSQGNRALGAPWTNINVSVRWDKCLIKKHNWFRFN